MNTSFTREITMMNLSYLAIFVLGLAVQFDSGCCYPLGTAIFRMLRDIAKPQIPSDISENQQSYRYIQNFESPEQSHFWNIIYIVMKIDPGMKYKKIVNGTEVIDFDVIEERLNRNGYDERKQRGDGYLFRKDIQVDDRGFAHIHYYFRQKDENDISNEENSTEAGNKLDHVEKNDEDKEEGERKKCAEEEGQVEENEEDVQKEEKEKDVEEAYEELEEMYEAEHGNKETEDGEEKAKDEEESVENEQYGITEGMIEGKDDTEKVEIQEKNIENGNVRTIVGSSLSKQQNVEDTSVEAEEINEEKKEFNDFEEQEDTGVMNVLEEHEVETQEYASTIGDNLSLDSIGTDFNQSENENEDNSDLIDNEAGEEKSDDHIESVEKKSELLGTLERQEQSEIFDDESKNVDDALKIKNDEIYFLNDGETEIIDPQEDMIEEELY